LRRQLVGFAYGTVNRHKLLADAKGRVLEAPVGVNVGDNKNESTIVSLLESNEANTQNGLLLLHLLRRVFVVVTGLGGGGGGCDCNGDIFLFVM
jgi:hypothetical protein